jgi:hypothetical protein
LPLESPIGDGRRPGHRTRRERECGPVSDDFWECAADHPDDIGVCCVFYGGDYDERTSECWIDHEAKLEDANPRPSVPPKHPVLTRVDRLPVYAMG